MSKERQFPAEAPDPKGTVTKIPVPSSLLAELQAAADEDQRPSDELVVDALEQYLKDRRWQRLVAYGEQQARSLGLTEADVPRLIEEYRQERRQGR